VTHSAEDTPEFPVVSSTVLYAGRVVTLRKDELQMPDGSRAIREIVGHPGAVGVVALDSEDRVVMVNQYRHAVRRRLDELPAGLLDVAGESALHAAQRELAEEAHLQAERWDVLIDLHTSPGFSEEAIRLFLARGLSASEAEGFVAEHEEESMTVTRVSLDEAVARIYRGEITNATAVAGILAATVGLGTEWSSLRPADAPWPDRPPSR
jgi:8-oxo-dGTP pyrophosphatase MutT (NUDIX family)